MVFLAEGGIGALGLNLPSLIAQLINFTILFLLLAWVSKRFLFPLLAERRKRIQEGLQAPAGGKGGRGDTGEGAGASQGRRERPPPLRRSGVRDRPRGRRGTGLVGGAGADGGGLLRSADGGRDAGGAHLHRGQDGAGREDPGGGRPPGAELCPPRRPLPPPPP